MGSERRARERTARLTESLISGLEAMDLGNAVDQQRLKNAGGVGVGKANQKKKGRKTTTA